MCVYVRRLLLPFALSLTHRERSQKREREREEDSHTGNSIKWFSGWWVVRGGGVVTARPVKQGPELDGYRVTLLQHYCYYYSDIQCTIICGKVFFSFSFLSSSRFVLFWSLMPCSNVYFHVSPLYSSSLLLCWTLIVFHTVRLLHCIFNYLNWE